MVLEREGENGSIPPGSLLDVCSPLPSFFIQLDGVRALWDGTTFWSRNGNHYAMPVALVAKVPKDVWLDGELWMERGM